METKAAPCHACGKYKYSIFLLYLVLLFSLLLGFKYPYSSSLLLPATQRQVWEGNRYSWRGQSFVFFSGEDVFLLTHSIEQWPKVVFFMKVWMMFSLKFSDALFGMSQRLTHQTWCLLLFLECLKITVVRGLETSGQIFPRMFKGSGICFSKEGQVREQ